MSAPGEINSYSMIKVKTQKTMIRTLIFTLALASGLTCMAGPNEHFLHTFGSFSFRDATNTVTVTASQQDGKPGSVLISWRGYDSTVTDVPPGNYEISQTSPLVTNGWFVFAEHATDVWVFDGVSLSLETFKGKTQEGSTVSASEVDKFCPKQVRDALPRSFFKNSLQ